MKASQIHHAGPTAATSNGRETPVLQLSNLRIAVGPRGRRQSIVDGVSFSILPGECLCIVGESGCGKSVTALALMGLAELSGLHVETDRLAFRGADLAGLPPRERARLRGGDMAMIFQEPMTSLNPAFRIGWQIEEAILSHRPVSRAEARRQAADLLHRVRIVDPEARLRDHPHQLSGGMRQRVMIAMALANRPRLLIADEPTTALDVTTQSRILALMQEIREETGAATLTITHDLGVVAEVADRVVVMYGGRVVERASVQELFSRPSHPYTLGLLASIPHPGAQGMPLVPIEGSVPALSEMPPGCRFATRCPFADARCHAEAPPEEALSETHAAACWKLSEVAA